MKKHIFFLLCLTVGLACSMAQKPKGHENQKERPRIEDIVDDLSQTQKRKLASIREESKKTIDALQAEKQAVRDSIHSLLHLDGDNSQKLFPLFEREGHIRAAISKEFYSTRLRINEVLTKEQREKVRKVYAAHFDKGNKSQKGKSKKH